MTEGAAKLHEANIEQHDREGHQNDRRNTDAPMKKATT
jgi:hypothetical protein